MGKALAASGPVPGPVELNTKFLPRAFAEATAPGEHVGCITMLARGRRLNKQGCLHRGSYKTYEAIAAY